MWTITYFAGALIAICLFFAGWLISQLIQKARKVDWEGQFHDAEKQVANLQKKLKNEKLQTEQQKKRADDYKLQIEDHKRVLAQSKTDLNAVKTKFADLELSSDKEKKYADNEIQRLQRINDKLDKDLNQQKEKYKVDMGDMRAWKSEKDKVQAEIANLKNKLTRANQSSADYKAKYESQLAEINGINELKRSVRASKSKINKLETDVSYWEKKHYDTHHELAELKKKSEGYQTEFLKLEELRKGDEVLKSNLVKQITEFKTKFLEVSNKYRSLTNK
jgi:chromosome segregation ATPase